LKPVKLSASIRLGGLQMAVLVFEQRAKVVGDQ